MGRLEYDTGAFSIFFLALWLAGLFPFTINAARTYLKSSSESDAVKVSPTYSAYQSAFVDRLVKRRRERALQERSETRGGAVKRLTLAAVGWAIVVGYLLSRDSEADIHKFDPFEILGISTSATELEIKKAYKKLSLVHHPDRWAKKDKSEQALAETKFIMVAKAYEALTDPIARENFQKYGNPDGRQALEMSIGLPAWLLEKDNQSWVIASYLLLSIVVFPTSVMLLTANAAAAGRNAVIPKKLVPDTEEILRYAIRSEYMRQFNAVAEVFSFAAEFKVLVYRSDDEKRAILDLRNQMAREDKYPMRPTLLATTMFRQIPSLKSSEGNEKALVLVWAHLNRLHDRLTTELQDDLEFILIRAPLLCRAIIQHSRVTGNFMVLTAAIFFQQHMYQAVAPTGVFLQEFPHIPEEHMEYFTREIAKRVKKKTEKNTLEKPARTLVQEWFLAWTKDKSFKVVDNPEEEAAVEAVLTKMPFKDLKFQVGTVSEIINKNPTGQDKDPRDNDYVFEEKSFQGDFIRTIIDLEEQNQARLNGNTSVIIEDGTICAHTPFMPIPIKEEWHVVVCGGPHPGNLGHIPSNENKVTAFTTLEDDGKARLRADMQFFTSLNQNDVLGSAKWEAKEYPILIFAFPSCYIENQKMGGIERFRLHDPSSMKKFQIHPDDEQLRHEPNSIFEMLQPQAQPEVDSDFEDETDDPSKDASD